MRRIYCPGVERWVSLKAYLRAVRFAKANPNCEFRHGLTCWRPCTGREIVQQFLAGMHDRINQCIPYVQRGKVNR